MPEKEKADRRTLSVKQPCPVTKPAGMIGFNQHRRIVELSAFEKHHECRDRGGVTPRHATIRTTATPRQTSQDVATELRQQTRIGGTLSRPCFNEEPVSGAETDQDAEQPELKKEKPTITRRDKRVNRTDKQPAIGNTAGNQNGYTTQAERGKSADYQRDDFSYRRRHLGPGQKNYQWNQPANPRASSAKMQRVTCQDDWLLSGSCGVADPGERHEKNNPQKPERQNIRTPWHSISSQR